MKHVVTVLTAVAAFTFTAGLQAAESKAGEDLARKNGCMICHSIDQKLVGPAFKEIAAKYKKQKDASAMLGERVKKGSTGVWGQMPMPPNSQIADEDINTLVEWILGS